MRVRSVLATMVVLGALGLLPAPAGARSVAYVDQGAVWLSTLDGEQKVRLAGPVTRPDGAVEAYIDVAQADNGRILAVRNEPGKAARLSTYRVWEPDGTSTVQGPLTAPAGWFISIYPLGLDLSSDGTFVTYGYANSSGCCPITGADGTYVRNADGNVLDPIDVTTGDWPTFSGSRLVTGSGTTTSTQDAAGAPLGPAFTPWLDFGAVGLDLLRTDVAANGKVAAAEFEQRDPNSAVVVGKVAVLGIDALGGATTGTPDCFLASTGPASDASLSQDATRIAWRDGGGVKVAGTPVTAADPCVLTSPPVTISATGTHGSIGGADVTRFLPVVPPAAGPGTTPPPPGTTTPPPTATGPAPTTTTPPTPGLGVALPARVSVAALRATRGVAVKVTAAAAGRVRVSGTVPASRLRRRGAPVVVLTGAATAARRGPLTVRLRLNATGRRQTKRLKGARVTLRVTQGSRRASRTLTLR